MKLSRWNFRFSTHGKRKKIHLGVWFVRAVGFQKLIGIPNVKKCSATTAACTTRTWKQMSFDFWSSYKLYDIYILCKKEKHISTQHITSLLDMHGTCLFTPSQLGLDPDLHVFLPSRWGANLLEKKHEISLKYLENDILHLHMRHLEAAWQFWGQGNACFHLSCPWSSARDWWLPTMWCQRPSEAFGRRRCVMKKELLQYQILWNHVEFGTVKRVRMALQHSSSVHHVSTCFTSVRDFLNHLLNPPSQVGTTKWTSGHVVQKQI